MKSTSKKARIAEVVRVYRKIESFQNKLLAELAAEAEKSGNYSDYDQACYDTWEYLMDEGSALATLIEGILDD